MVHSTIRPPVRQKRFQRLLDASVWAFGQYGFQRCQIADIAQAAGVALGTVYRYAESKVSLFDAAVRLGFGDASALETAELPLSDPAPGATLQFLRETLTEFHESLTARRIAWTDGRYPIEEELPRVVGLLYDALAENRGGIRIVDRSAREWPELAEVFFRQVREPGLTEFEGYLAERIAAGVLRPVPHLPTAARQILEMCAWMGIHRKWTPGEESITDKVARESVLHFTVRTLLPDSGVPR